MTEKNPTPVVETIEPVEGTEPSTGSGEASKKVEGIEEPKGNNITLENIQKIIADSIEENNQKNNDKFEKLQNEKNEEIQKLKDENKKLLDEKNLAEKINFLNDKGLDPTLIPFISNVPEEREEQAKILISVIEKAQLQALKTDMNNNSFKPKSGLKNTSVGRNLNKFSKF